MLGTRKRRSHRSTHPTRTKTKRFKRDADYSPRLDADAVKKALTELLKDAYKNEIRRVLEATESGKSIADIVEDELYVYLVITLKQAPYKPLLRPHAIPLKHSIFTAGEDDICFFVKDPQRQIKDYLAEFGEGEVTRVMGVDKLRKRYKTHEGRRELLNMYDLFLVDNRVAPMMPNLLGSAFIRAKKMPLCVDMRRNVMTGIRKAIHSTAFTPIQGTCSAMKVGKVEFGVDRLVENVCGAMDAVIRKIDGGWLDVQSVNLKTNKSPTLPIYLAMPTPMEINKEAAKEASGQEHDGKEVCRLQEMATEIKPDDKGVTKEGKNCDDKEISQRKEMATEIKPEEVDVENKGKKQGSTPAVQKEEVATEIVSGDEDVEDKGQKEDGEQVSRKEEVETEVTRVTRSAAKKEKKQDGRNLSQKAEVNHGEEDVEKRRVRTPRKRRSGNRGGEKKKSGRENYGEGQGWGSVN